MWEIVFGFLNLILLPGRLYFYLWLVCLLIFLYYLLTGVLHTLWMHFVMTVLERIGFRIRNDYIIQFLQHCRLGYYNSCDHEMAPLTFTRCIAVASKAYITILIRQRYHDPFDYDESDRNYDMRLIRLRYNYDTTTTKNWYVHFLLASNGSRRTRDVVFGL